jgi:hypothetical protein
MSPGRGACGPASARPPPRAGAALSARGRVLACGRSLRREYLGKMKAQTELFTSDGAIRSAALAGIRTGPRSGKRSGGVRTVLEMIRGIISGSNRRSPLGRGAQRHGPRLTSSREFPPVPEGTNSPGDCLRRGRAEPHAIISAIRSATRAGCPLGRGAQRHGPRLTFPPGRRFAPSQGQARALCWETMAGKRALGSARSCLKRSPGAFPRRHSLPPGVPAGSRRDNQSGGLFEAGTGGAPRNHQCNSKCSVCRMSPGTWHVVARALWRESGGGLARSTF